MESKSGFAVMMTFKTCMISIQRRSQAFIKRTSSDSSASRKRTRSGSSSEARKSHEAQPTMNYTKLAKLEEKNGDKYSSEQLRTWANLIQLKRHTSLDTPPDYPFLGGTKKSKIPSHLQMLRVPLH